MLQMMNNLRILPRTLRSSRSNPSKKEKKKRKKTKKSQIVFEKWWTDSLKFLLIIQVTRDTAVEKNVIKNCKLKDSKWKDLRANLWNWLQSKLKSSFGFIRASILQSWCQFLLQSLQILWTYRKIFQPFERVFGCLQDPMGFFDIRRRPFLIIHY